LLLAATAFVFWANDASPANDIALNAMRTDSKVNVVVDSGIVTFMPADSTPTMGFVFYPGGRVDYRAYAPVLKLIAAKGYLVALVPASLDLAFLYINAAARVESLHPEIREWAVGGHSLGGVAASRYASAHVEVTGVVFWASYPADDSLEDSGKKVISIYATNDGLAARDKIEESRALLPGDAQFVAIEGGNHAQFGSYGPQAGDNDASIPPEEQWLQTADATVKFLERLMQ
jgi:pimeloyl-ACP methyl ester carboxylesterase